MVELTGCPRPGEGLLYAVPVIAPYNALSAFAVRAKITPGQGRKGRAAKSAAGALAAAGDLTPRARELIKAVPSAELTLAMMGSCHVSMPGLLKIRAGAQRDKVAKAKAKAAKK